MKSRCAVPAYVDALPLASPSLWCVLSVMKKRTQREVWALVTVGLALALGGCPRRIRAADDHRSPPTPGPTTPERWQAVSAGIDHTCAIAHDRSAWCWGSNYSGQFDGGSEQSSQRPVQALGATNWNSVRAGPNSTQRILRIRANKGDAT